MAIKLTRFKTHNFKNIQTGENGFCPGNLSILIGPNGCGKSNLMAALRFFKEALVSGEDENRSGTPLELALNDLLGAPKIYDATLERPQTAQFILDFESEDFPEGIRLDLSLKIQKQPPQIYIKEETLSSLRTNNIKNENFIYYKFHNQNTSKGVISIHKSTGQGTEFKTVEGCPTNNLALREIPRLLENYGFSPEKTPLYKVRRLLIDFISKWRFYNANYMMLEAIRFSEPKVGLTDMTISSSGKNLPTVLDNMFQQDLDFEESITEACRSILPSTRKLRVTRPGRLNLSIEWHIKNFPNPFFLNEMSDGSIRMLCWAVILKSPSLPPLIVIDEPELSLHVAWISVLAKWIKEAAARGSQIIIITHSSDLLDHFSDQVENVHCFKYEGNFHFSIAPLSKGILSERLDEEGWQLGDLYRVGDPDVGGWPW
ncbi:MAG: AAA family ATPase [Magnetococcus sp. DMHC-6]